MKKVDKTVEIAIPIRAHRIDIDTHHDTAFALDVEARKDDDCLVMCFRTDAVILTVNGMETAHPGDCMLHARAFRRFHTSVPGARHGFRNDWFYIEPSFFLPLLKRSGLPLNTLIPTGKPDLLEEVLHRLLEEVNNPDEFSPAAIRHIVALMLLNIRRAQTRNLRRKTELTRSQRYYYDALLRLREALRKNPERDYSIGALAAEIHLSKERFNVLYRELFGTSPYTELVSSRLVLAKRLLTATAMPVKEVALRCGWHDVHYFSRLFHGKTGCTPGEFRKGNRPNERKSFVF